MKFTDIAVSRENRFSLGIESVSGEHYLSIPVSNRLVDYEEYYRITTDQFALFKSDTDAALSFIAKCRARQLDELLFLKPGTDRGV